MRGRIAAVGAALVVLTFAAFSGVLSNAFVNYDDDVYVTANPHVLDGLSAKGVAWSMRSTYAANWHPLTWISHMLDVEAFELDAGRHHLTSLLLHATNVVLLFLLLVRLSGALWRPALVAGLFAIHPLHVESVAWIAERKDVLSTLFWLLTVGAWLRWLDSKTPARYALVLVLFALGLMAKPMLVTLPFALMLLDFWPLKRATLPPLWKEKAPLLAMSAASIVVTIVAQSSAEAIRTFSALPFPDRLANAMTAYVFYLGKMLWPASLACFYPYPGSVVAWPVIGSALLLLGVTALVLRLAKRAPYLAFGWAWYLGTLVPVIGLVQVGAQAAADRYTYVPLIGVFVAIAWGLAALADARPRLRPAVAAAAAATLAALIPVTRAQVGIWRDNIALFGHAAAVTRDNNVAHNNLGLAYLGAGKTEEAAGHFKEALRIKPDYVEARINLGAALHALGRDAEAVDLLRPALATNPNAPGLHVNLANSLAATGRTDAAIEQYEQALRLQPELFDADAYNRLGIVLAGSGRLAEALERYEQAIRLKPDYAAAMNNAGLALAGLNRLPEAIERFDRAVRLAPAFAQAHNNLGVALARVGRIPEAIDQFEEAVRIDPGFTQARESLSKLQAARR